jgi:type III restriction enzyme
MPRKKKQDAELLDISEHLRTAACVPALRQAVAQWKADGYPGITDTTRILLGHWFHPDGHRLKNGRFFRYHAAQQEAIEALVYVWEVARARRRKDLLERFASKALLGSITLPKYDDFARYAIKMATGSGKTKVMSLAVVWQYLNAMREAPELAQHYAKTFLVVAPNIIVLERLLTDFRDGRIFLSDPLVPKALQLFWDVRLDSNFIMRDDGERPTQPFNLFLTNVQQLYPRENGEREPNPLEAMLGSAPPAKLTEAPAFAERIHSVGGPVMVLNDEAHHTWDEDSAWNQVIRTLHAQDPLWGQLDFSATPRFSKTGSLFPWIISDYPLKQAIQDGIVKRPVKGITQAKKARSDDTATRYQAYLVAAVERWREYRAQLEPFGKKPILFVMMNSTAEADEVGDWLRKKYPSEFAGEQTLVIHTKERGDQAGSIVEKDLDLARKASREIDDNTSPINAVVSVLMLREGWDVQNVTVVVGLRPYTAKANILPEQAIGRGLRLMFRDLSGQFTERVDIIGNKAFLEFVEDLEKLEEIRLETFELGKDKLEILAIQPVAEKASYDIAFPVLSPALVRKTNLADEIARLDVSDLVQSPLPLKQGSTEAKSFRYEGRDILTLEMLFDRSYQIPEPQTAQEVIGYYSRYISNRCKLPGQFAAIAPKVREWFEHHAFGKTVNLDAPEVIRAMGSNVANYVCTDAFVKLLSSLSIAEQTPEVTAPPRLLSELKPFPYSSGRPFYEARKCILNLVPCGNEFERGFAKFLDSADDVKAFCKVPDEFGFSIEYTDGSANLRNYFPDFVAVGTDGTHWLLETKGAETEEVRHKDQAARLWCKNATELTGTLWKYLKVRQKAFNELQPDALTDLQALESGTLFR